MQSRNEPLIPALSRLCCSRVRLPKQRHIPGSQSVADHALLATIVARLPATICAGKWRQNLPYRYGWFLFANHYYWESHEIWEAVWMRADINSRERFLLQGLIQLANAGLKRRQGKDKASARITALAAECFESTYPPKSHENLPNALMGVSRTTAQQLLQIMHY